MHLDERLFTDLFVDQELRDELTLVALKLNDVSVFRILNDASVAVEPLFAFLENDLLVDLRIDSLRERSKIYKVERVSQSSRSAVNEARALSLSLERVRAIRARDSAHAVAHLHSRPTLSSVALLHANVNVVVLHGIRRFFLLLFALYFVSKVERFVRKGIVRWNDIRTKRARRQSSSHHQSALSFVVESTTSPFAREARLGRSIPRVSIHTSREFDTARASNDRSFSRPSRVDASRPETRLATRRPDSKPRGEGSIAIVARSSSDAARATRDETARATRTRRRTKNEVVGHICRRGHRGRKGRRSRDGECGCTRDEGRARVFRRHFHARTSTTRSRSTRVRRAKRSSEYYAFDSTRERGRRDRFQRAFVVIRASWRPLEIGTSAR